MPNKNFFFTEKRKPVQEIMDLIKDRYVDAVNIDSLADTAIQAILSKLDPHTVYIPASELQEVNDDIAGKFYGVGIEFTILDDTINVTSVLKDGPGDKAGVQIGDQFLKIGDSVATGKTINGDKVKSLLRGDRSTKINVVVLRAKQQKVVTITRDAIPVSSVDASYMIDNSIGYIRLNKFSTQTYREFMVALDALKKKGLQKLILDLRGNGGGVLEEAVEIADEFLEGDKLITYTEGKHMDKKEYRCRRQGQFEKGDLVVLADEGTASASEILIGALQDWDRATIIGRRTYGKGLVQEQFDLSDNSALRLVVARYYTPIGRSIQRSYSNGNKAYFDEISNRYHDGEIFSPDSIKNDKNKIYKTKGGKVVYGGGGISPDFFVPIDTAGFSLNVAKIFARNTINNFSYRYYLQHEAQIKAYKSSDDFAKNFAFTEDSWQQFVSAAAKDSVSLGAASANEKKELEVRIRAALAHHIWRNEGFFEVLNTDDKGVSKALEVLRGVKQ